MAKFKIWTDGACKGNPGPAGWAYVMRNGIDVVCASDSGHIPHATNNVAELTAVIAALETLKDGSDVVLNTDSMYVINGITKWLKGWKRKGWINSRQEPVANRDLWEELEVHDKRMDVTWRHVKGHAGHLENEWCDEEAVRRCRT